jgi:hypothetical protein
MDGQSASRSSLSGGVDMKNNLFMIISSLMPLALLKLFAENNSTLAQTRQGQPQKGASSGPGLDAYSLPAGTITADDLPGIKTQIQQVLDKINESIKPAGKRADYQTIKSGMLTLQDWLKRQGCISQASTTYDLEATDKYSENIFLTYPGQLPFDIVFNMDGDVKKPYRLLVFVTTVDLFNFASLAENRSSSGVPVPKNWPKDTMSYWENRP